MALDVTIIEIDLIGDERSDLSIKFGYSFFNCLEYCRIVHYVLGEWLNDLDPSLCRNMMLIVRFLGTTPQSSAIDSTLLSICQQLCYNMVSWKPT